MKNPVFLFNRKVAFQISGYWKYMKGFSISFHWHYPWDKKDTSYRIRKLDVIYQARG